MNAIFQSCQQRFLLVLYVVLVFYVKKMTCYSAPRLNVRQIKTRPNLSISSSQLKVLVGFNGSNMVVDDMSIDDDCKSCGGSSSISDNSKSSDNRSIILYDNSDGPQFSRVVVFLSRAGAIGLLTGLAIVLFKNSIAYVALLFYDRLAELLPRPAFYWPLAVFPALGSCIVSLLTFILGPSISNGIDSIASGVDTIDGLGLGGEGKTDEKGPTTFRPTSLLTRLTASVFTLASGCSLGPEGPSVEIGAGISRVITAANWGAFALPCSSLERRQLFLAGTAAAVSAGNFPLDASTKRSNR